SIDPALLPDLEPAPPGRHRVGMRRLTRIGSSGFPHMRSAPRPLPERPSLRDLRDQVRNLLQAGHAQSIPAAQFQVARVYGFQSWPKVKAHVASLEQAGMLRRAIDTNHFERVRYLMECNPELHRAPMGYARNGPLTWVAECRVPWGPPGPERLAMA